VIELDVVTWGDPISFLLVAYLVVVVVVVGLIQEIQ